MSDATCAEEWRHPERMGSWMNRTGTRVQIAAAFTYESGGWSLACVISRREGLWFVEAGALPVQIYTNEEKPRVPITSIL